MFRALSFIFLHLRRHTPAEWLLVLGLSWWGWVQFQKSPTVGYGYWAGAVLIALLSLAGRAMRYVIFVPDRRPLKEAGSLPSTVATWGLASGHFRLKNPDIFYLPESGEVIGVPVLVRWVGHASVPHLAVMETRTPDLDTTWENWWYRADGWSLWYPGTEVTPGWIYVGGRKSYGLRLAFVGKVLLLGLQEPAEAAVLAALLAQTENCEAKGA